ncbi:TPA: hypothetical protein MW131_003123 [Acinetobacter baumannii]|uniref:hypothetical protein n=1 Tax=Acinetobacter baumannii TaxID=470 RepID=UPI00244BC313|nr:hypothetical protein [Acinetobacter baumannii]MDH2620554.1 hypothetical protein [Acinetobacter baumannii]HCA5052840.1 hypothetical protein [Acinetobacter baumannii]
MCDSKDFWSWLGCNAGQIQILIAVIALLLAIIPIRHAYRQFKLSNAQREFELKISLFNTVTQTIGLLNSSYEQYFKVIQNLENFILNLQKLNHPDLNAYSELLLQIKSQQQYIENQAEQMNNYAQTIQASGKLTIEKLEDNLNEISRLMVSTTNYVTKALGMISDIERAKRETKI